MFYKFFSQVPFRWPSDGQDGQVGAGHGSHVGPEGPDQLRVRSSARLSTHKGSAFASLTSAENSDNCQKLFFSFDKFLSNV